jgi:hypothetical protein
MGLGAPASHCGALVELDWSSEVARAADDGGQWWRRRSGVARGREKGMAVKFWLQEQKTGCSGGSRRALSC